MKTKRVYRLSALLAAVLLSGGAFADAENLNVTSSKERPADATVTVDFAVDGDVLTCRVAGRIDTITAPVLLEVLEENGEGIKEFRLDATKLQYISSAGLRVLLMASKKTGKVTVTNTSEAVKDIFETTGFDQLMTVE